MGSEIVIVPAIVLGLPWIIFHYITRWKTAASLTAEDENLLDDLNDLARRLDDRMCTLERIMAAENPNWRAVACDPAKDALEDRRSPSFDLGRDVARANQPARRI
jgi:phage shock protein B